MMKQTNRDDSYFYLLNINIKRPWIRCASVVFALLQCPFVDVKSSDDVLS